MYYITMLTTPTPPIEKNAKAAFDFLYGHTNTLDIREKLPYQQTFTRAVEYNDLPVLGTAYTVKHFETLLQHIAQFKEAYPDPTNWYQIFHVPKRSGGLRKICAPIEALKILQAKVVYVLQHMPGYYDVVVHAHNTAFAYIKGRSTADAIKLHQANNSNWFLKLDIKDFFPSCTTAVVKKLLKQLYPLYAVPDTTLDEILSVCTFNDALPQGAVTSPLLTNLMMVPIDKAISDLTHAHTGKHLVYTRYADDLLISAREAFNWKELQLEIATVLGEEGFKLNTTKTRYGSKAGSNWNLGIMLNKDNNMTLGHKHKQRTRAAVFNFLTDAANGIFWTPEDTMVLNGKLSYMRSIEPGYTDHIIQKYETKTGMNYKQVVKHILSM